MIRGPQHRGKIDERSQFTQLGRARKHVKISLCDTGSDGTGINRAVMKRQDPRQPWMNYMDVANIDTTLEQASNLGAKIALGDLNVCPYS